MLSYIPLCMTYHNVHGLALLKAAFAASGAAFIVMLSLMGRDVLEGRGMTLVDLGAPWA